VINSNGYSFAGPWKGGTGNKTAKTSKEGTIEVFFKRVESRERRRRGAGNQ